MEIPERPNFAFNFAVNTPSDSLQQLENEEVVATKQRKLDEARKHVASIDEKIQELQVMLRRLARKPRFHKLQYVLKHRIAVYSGNLSYPVFFYWFCANVYPVFILRAPFHLR